MATTQAPPANRIVNIDPEIMGGTPVFMGTRVPIKNLWDFLERGYSLDEFLEDFPSVKRDQVLGLLAAARQLVAESTQAA